MMRDKTSALDATLLLSWWKEEEEEQEDLEEDLEHLDEDKGEEEKGENEFETRKEQDYLQSGFDKQLFVSFYWPKTRLTYIYVFYFTL